jgi:predicted metalloprotease
MRWGEGRESSNVEDRRGESGGGGGGMGRGIAGGGIGMVVLALIAMYFGIDPSVVLQGGGALIPQEQSATQRPGPAPAPPKDDTAARFVAVVLGDTEDTWKALFRQANREYQEPKLVLFRGAVQSACGTGQSAMGPFYCPGDQKVYIDLAFFEDMKTRFKAPGDFAQAYVIAHEVGHHVQNLLGIAAKVHQARSRMSEAEFNKVSVRMELQADCFAGVWAHHAHKARNIIEAGDVEEALAAATAIGDDRLQQQARGHITPESFTHGTSAQRVRWFRRGIESGSLKQCDTFAAQSL